MRWIALLGHPLLLLGIDASLTEHGSDSKTRQAYSWTTCIQKEGTESVRGIYITLGSLPVVVVGN